MPTDIGSIIQPEVLTVELAVILAVILFSMLYGSIKLRSMLGMFGYMLMVITLILSFITQLQFLWFWMVVILETFILVLASFMYARMAARGNR